MTSRSDKGMTLIELLLALVIGSVLTGAVFQAMFVGLRTTDDTNQRIAGSNDTQLIASYFTSDVASAESVSTGATRHPAPSINTGSVTDTQLVAFWSLRTNTALQTPDDMSVGWNIATPTGVTPGLRAAIGDQPNQDSGVSGDSNAVSATGTSSITHTVALTRSLSFAAIGRRAVASSSAAAATQLIINKPAGTSAGDVLLAHIVTSGGTVASFTPPAGWTLLESRSSGTTLTSLVYHHVAASGDPTSWTWRWSLNVLNALGGIAAYTGAASALPAAGFHASAMNPCGGQTPLLLLNWTDRETGVAHDVSYEFRAVGQENQLVRLHCTNGSGTPDGQQTLARNLAPSAAAVTCAARVTQTTTTSSTSTTIAAAPACTLPVTVTLSLGESRSASGAVGRTYQLSATTRTETDQ